MASGCCLASCSGLRAFTVLPSTCLAKLCAAVQVRPRKAKRAKGSDEDEDEQVRGWLALAAGARQSLLCARYVEQPARAARQVLTAALSTRILREAQAQQA